ncbi:hypothetical protein KKJ17_04620 [Xenorhabdus bovienii]|uniref:hypothetical protein n=1 Tax=Xenorhabdus bovienii TaxID=40576 RepID=UPI0012D34A8B|nr:hypothetical protein [Xenorhabdus bovienii]MDE9457665.1 hypothetical protein [Xenorhabdus bovienii]MDE9492455.1 hypothetical protein [Xenorhabdus bovienii]MDE9500982.1 hypothetical protein [Xenorhabdus bovienii]MDE9514542.1 hypothetical protein [Xenorhabdus bovienii]MDE9517048.1 hypothetical protein [Xenorhabdus bovienii]
MAISPVRAIKKDMPIKEESKPIIANRPDNNPDAASAVLANVENAPKLLPISSLREND